MRLLSGVVWSEGMHLAPHHFQVQSRYFEDSIQFAASALWFGSYGLAGIEMDAEALHNGTASLLHARGVFQDGLPFNIPESDALPAVRPIGDLFPPTRDSMTVLLGIPARRPNGINCALEGVALNGDSPPRFLAESRLLPDENTGRDERPVTLGRKNLRLLFDTEPAANLLTLPVARVVRDSSGHFAYDGEFVPPVLEIQASRRLLSLLQRLLEILDDKSQSLGRPAGASDFSTREIANFWELHCVNAAIPPLRHLFTTKRAHPEELFGELARLGGALCTFRLESHPRDLPFYDHDNLGSCFTGLDRHIREHLETIVPTNCISIPLAQSEKYFWDGEITDQRCLGRSRWLVAIRARMGETELMTRAPDVVKVCSSAFVRELVKRALPGLALSHLPVPPPAVSAKVETQYFGLSRGGPCWDHIAQTRRVGLYFPGDIPEPEVEILVVLDN